jgi:hypothetical protein
MRGKVTYRLVGGPYDGEINTMPAMYCRDSLAISDIWVGQGRDGGVKLMDGPMPPRAPWISFTRAIYEKVKPVVPGNVTYQFVRIEDVDRCEKLLTDKARRCLNEAEIGGKYCHVHVAVMKRASQDACGTDPTDKARIQIRRRLSSNPPRQGHIRYPGKR